LRFAWPLHNSSAIYHIIIRRSATISLSNVKGITYQLLFIYLFLDIYYIFCVLVLAVLVNSCSYQQRSKTICNVELPMGSMFKPQIFIYSFKWTHASALECEWIMVQRTFLPPLPYSISLVSLYIKLIRLRAIYVAVFSGLFPSHHHGFLILCVH